MPIYIQYDVIWPNKHTKYRVEIMHTIKDIFNLRKGCSRVEDNASLCSQTLDLQSQHKVQFYSPRRLDKHSPFKYSHRIQWSKLSSTTQLKAWVFSPSVKKTTDIQIQYSTPNLYTQTRFLPRLYSYIIEEANWVLLKGRTWLMVRCKWIVEAFSQWTETISAPALIKSGTRCSGSTIICTKHHRLRIILGNTE